MKKIIFFISLLACGYVYAEDNEPPKGNVILNPGSNVTVEAFDDVYIKNGFEVKLGATFTTIPAE